MSTTYLLSFGETLTPEALAALQGKEPGALFFVPLEVAIDPSADAATLAAQVTACIDQAGFKPMDWLHQNFLVCLPEDSTAAGMVLVDLFGRTCSFPRIVRVHPTDGSVQVIDLELLLAAHVLSV